ncbi:MAG: metallophosphoesterase [Clostridia bacterium]|nr:metallophosphoesterase [Clostridia bacterium]
MKLFLITLIVFIAAALLIYIISCRTLTVSRTVVILPGIDREYTVVHLADMHKKYWGDDNSRLCSIIDEIAPDAILCTGDMTDTVDTGSSPFAAMVKNLSGRFPVYLSLGNHEARLKTGYPFGAKSYFDELRRSGVVILDNESAKLFGRIRLYGYSFDYETKPDKTLLDRIFGEPEQPSILMAHDPGYAEEYAEWGCGLILSGHIHGGAIRIPFVGGVLSPDKKLFPKYDSGLYDVKGKKLYVSRGVGYYFPDRFLSFPELSVIKLMPENP